MASLKFPSWRAALLACGLAALSCTATAVDTSPVLRRDPGSHLAPGWEYGGFMEIFVRGWRDSNGDGVGDLRGLIQSLDYLQALGIKGIWLMPITPSADGDHGYATTDFRAIEPAYGSMEDFDELLRQAHQRGIGVIMDYVINHSAASHPLFVASQDPASPYRNWYVWQDPVPTGWDIWGKDPWNQTPAGNYFATFGPHMPDFNFRNPAVRKFHQDSLRFWLNRGLDGYRLDAVPHLIENSAKEWNDQPQSRHLTARLRALVQRYANRYVVCEATAKPLAYGTPALCGSAFAFGHQYDIVKAAKGEPEAVRAVADYFVKAPQRMATMVSNHDIFAGRRLWDQVDGNLAQYKLAAATYLLEPGIPFIYYGEEIGMAGAAGLPGDEPLRSPMSWSADPERAGFTSGTPFRPIAPNAAQFNAQAEQSDPNSLWSYYRDLLHLRTSHPSLARGNYRHAWSDGQVIAYQRHWGRETSLVVINYGQQATALQLPGLAGAHRLAPLYPTTGATVSVDASGHAGMQLAPQTVQVWEVLP